MPLKERKPRMQPYPMMLTKDDDDFLQSLLDPREEHLKSRSAIVRHLIRYAKKHKEVLKEV